jgi:hypothetical protein
MLEDYSIQDFIKPACIIHLPQQKSKARIDEALLSHYAPRDGLIEGGHCLSTPVGEETGTRKDTYWSVPISPGRLLNGYY